MLVNGFAPVVGKDAGILILGTLPGGESIRLNQYYADQGNSFWSIFNIRGNYGERVQGLIENRISIWNVLQSAERGGSLDRKIVKGTEVPNDFEVFFAHHASIEEVFFNGRRAESYFRKLVLPHLKLSTVPPRWNSALPSTSRTNTHLTNDAKAEIWRVGIPWLTID